MADEALSSSPSPPIETTARVKAIPTPERYRCARRGWLWTSENRRSG